jgi:hypothetical protein
MAKIVTGFAAFQNRLIYLPFSGVHILDQPHTARARTPSALHDEPAGVRDLRLALGLKVGEDCEHGAVVLARGWQSQLRKDVRDVLLDGADRQDETIGDCGVRSALGDQSQYLELSRRQKVDRISGFARR